MREQKPNIGTIDEIVIIYAKNIKRAARRVVNLRLYDKWLHEDLVQQGYMGLIEAYARYDFNETEGCFWSYARKFVKGRMVDYTIQYFNYIRPSKQVNGLMLQINKMNLRSKTPNYIADVLGCSYKMAAEALNLLIARQTSYLYDPIKTNHPDDPAYNSLIDVIVTEPNGDDLFKADIMNGSSILEKRVIQMFIDGYSRENIMENSDISAKKLKETIDSILVICGYDYKTIHDRNEARLMELSTMEELQTTAETNFEWINIQHVSSSPKNPRKNLSINTKHMQDIISDKGWEEAITCYKKGRYYIILSGHRRWYAAKQLGEKIIPVYVVPAPANHAEEMARLGSLQSSQVEWTPYESAKNTYDRWLYSRGKSYRDLGRKMGLTEGRVGAKIRVYKYYPKEEIEGKLANGMYTITMLDYIYSWIKRLAQYHPDFIESIGEDFIRQQMLRKYENKCVNSQVVNDKSFVSNATSEEIFQFLSDTNKTLRQCQIEILMARSNWDFHTEQLDTMMRNSKKGLSSIEWKDEKEAKQLLLEIEKLMLEIKAKSKELTGGA